MKYVDQSIGSMWWPKILGTYERELAAIIETLCREAPRHIIDVGAAEGYYAIGFAWRCPQSQVTAFEGEASGRALQSSLAKLNGVAARVKIAGFCDQAELRDTLTGKESGLIICDIEGGELALLDPESIPELTSGRWTLLVEIHEHVHAGIVRILTERFSATHSSEEILTVEREPKNLLPAVRCFGLSRWVAPYLDERRPGPMRWLLLRPKL
ncbi:hypothetical protein [Oleiharenicola lentus]|uniref:hypothetical protein n=1 Tax=Oleiharenicola lentus TaxID=2508720 RepID=UPI003F6766F5